MTLVRIVKDWEWAGLLRQTPGRKGIWDGIEFTIDQVEECDYLIVLNNRKASRTKAHCPKENVWAIMQEPYVKYLYDWIVEGHEHFSRVFTHHIPSNSPKYISSQPAIPWHINRTFDQLIEEKIPEKSKNISWVTSKLTFLPGHQKKMAFLDYLKRKSRFDMDVFGRGIRYVADKWDALAPYKYSIAVENSTGPDYWTEKVSDCFLTWTVPIYYGCTNLEDYFPKESFIRIDIDRPESSLDKIQEIIKNNDWEKRIPALNESRNLVLYKYQIFPYLSELIRSDASEKMESTDILIPAYGSKKLIHQLKYVADRISHGDFPGLFSTYLNKLKYINWEIKKERVM
jgi:hypothetical protein